jgi:hypothetical protein
MKIIDLIPCVKKDKLDMRSYKAYGGGKQEWCANSTAQQEQFKKLGYYYQADIHSQSRKWLLNNLDKEVVMAYIKERFATIMLIKCKGDNYKVLSYISTSDLGIGGYSVFQLNVVNLENGIKNMEANKDILQIVDEEEFNRAKRKILLQQLEKGDKNG